MLMVKQPSIMVRIMFFRGDEDNHCFDKDNLCLDKDDLCFDKDNLCLDKDDLCLDKDDLPLAKDNPFSVCRCSFLFLAPFEATDEEFETGKAEKSRPTESEMSEMLRTKGDLLSRPDLPDWVVAKAGLLAVFFIFFQ